MTKQSDQVRLGNLRHNIIQLANKRKPKHIPSSF